MFCAKMASVKGEPCGRCSNAKMGPLKFRWLAISRSHFILSRGTKFESDLDFSKASLKVL